MTHTASATSPSRPQSTALAATLMALALGLCCPASQAQSASPRDESRQEIRRAAVAEALVEETVIEDDSTRIEETRVRGQTQKVTVQSKNSKLPAYEIIMGDGSRDLSAGPGSTRGAAGKRVWNILNF